MTPVGIGLRAAHQAQLLAQRPALGFVEVHAENVFARGSAARAALLQAADCWPISLHGVGLGLGSAAGLDAGHLARLAQLLREVPARWVSEHLAFARAPLRAGGPVWHAADLLPPAFTAAQMAILLVQIDQAQQGLQRPLLVENLSACLHWADDDWPEGEFLAELARRSGCGLLLDVNNLVVSAINRGEADPVAAACAAVDALQPGQVGEIHLAGHSLLPAADGAPPLAIDDHGSRVSAGVWQVYRHAIARLGAVPTLIEWDTALPPLAVLLDEARLAREAMAQAQGRAPGRSAGPAPRFTPPRPAPADAAPADRPVAHPRHPAAACAQIELRRQQGLLAALWSGRGADRPGEAAPTATDAPGAPDVPEAPDAPDAPDAPEMSGAPAAPGAPAAHTAAPLVPGHPLRGSPARQWRGLQAYRGNARAVAQRALAAAYPTLAQMLGDEALARLAWAHWLAHPPRAGDLADWGGALADQLQGHPPDADGAWPADPPQAAAITQGLQALVAEHPWLPAVARLDWAVHRAAQADAPPEGPPAALQALGRPDAPRWRLRFAPGLALVESGWPLATWWLAHQPAAAAGLLPAPPGPPDPGTLAQALACRQAESALVWREGWQPRVQALPAAEAAFMRALLAGAALAQALAAAPGLDFEAWLLAALRQHWIAAFEPPTDDGEP